MPPPRRNNQAAARLRQLACLDVTGPQAISPVLAELHQLIGFDAGCLIHPGAQGEMEVFMENPVLQAAMPDYFDPRIQDSEAGGMRRGARHFSEALRLERGVQMLPQMAKGSVPALAPSEADAGDNEVCGQGLLVASPEGRLQWVSPEAQTLLALGLGTRWRVGLGDLPDVVQLLVQRLFWPDASDDGPLPEVTLRTANGAFSLRATRLAGVAGAGEAAAIHITHRVPRGIQLLARLRTVGLPRRQAGVD